MRLIKLFEQATAIKARALATTQFGEDAESSDYSAAVRTMKRPGGSIPPDFPPRVRSSTRFCLRPSAM